MTQAKFISIEGLEGVGKSTVKDVICNALQQAHINYVLTREPGGTNIAEMIRDVILQKGDEVMLPLTEALLFFAGRNQNIQEIIKPALATGSWVVCDRFVDSSIAYQGGGRGVDNAQLTSLSQWVCGDMKPDLTILLDAPVEVGFARIENREKDRIEAESRAFFERVRSAYLELAAAEPTRYRIIKADQDVDQVKQDISALMNEVISKP